MSGGAPFLIRPAGLVGRGVRLGLRGLPYLAATAAILVILPSSKLRFYDGYVLPKELVLHAIAAVTAGLALWRRASLRIGWVELFLLGGFLLGAISTLQAFNPWMSLRALEMSFSAIAIFWLTRNLADDAPGRHGTTSREVLRIVAVAVAACTAAVLLEAFGCIDRISMPGRAPGGLSANRNFAAHLIVLGIPVLVYLVMTSASRIGVALGTMAVFAGTVAIVLARCRSAWLAMFFIAAVAGWFALTAPAARRALRRRAACWCAAAFPCAVAFAVLVPNELRWNNDDPYVETLTEIGAYDRGTGKGRLIQYQNTLELIGRRPWLGVGPGNWSIGYFFVSDRTDPNVRQWSTQPVNRMANTDWLSLAAERGVPAAGCFILAGLLLVRRREHLALGRTAASATIVAGLAVMGSLDAVLQRPEPLLIVALALAALAGPPAPVRRVRLGYQARRFALVTLVVLGSAATVDGARLVAAERLAYEGGWNGRKTAARLVPGDFGLECALALHAQGAGRCEEAEQHARRALARHPRLPRCTAVIRQCSAQASAR